MICYICRGNLTQKLAKDILYRSKLETIDIVHENIEVKHIGYVS